jgi:hypothetical protein
VVAREDENNGRQGTPRIRVEGGWREKCGLHAPESETHLLVHAGHAPVRGRWKRP